MQVFVLDTLINLCFDIFHILFGKLVRRCYWGYFFENSNNYFSFLCCICLGK